MLKHYIKFAIRNFRSNKVVFLGSLATLCLGTLSMSLLYTYIDNELSMNDFSKKETTSKAVPNEEQLEKQSDIYLMIMRTSPKSIWTVSSPSLFWNFDYKQYPELNILVEVRRFNEGELKFEYQTNKFYPSGLVVDSTFFEVFDYQLKEGNIKTALNDINSVILSEKFAKNIFGDENPIGKDIKINEVDDDLDEFYKVTGVMSVPSNSSLVFDYLIPTIEDSNKFLKMGGDFILTKPGFDKDAFINKIKDITQTHVAERMRNYELNVISLNEIYFNQELNIDYIGIFSKFGDERNNNIILIIMLVILVISALNFSNLQIVNINAILKQIGITKINGAKHWDLIFQKLTEISMLLLVVLTLTTMSYRFVLPTFNNFFDIELSPSVLHIIKMNLIILLVLAILAFTYPTIIIYKLSPIKSLKSKNGSSKHLVGKKVVTIIQYALTSILLIFSIIVANQLSLMLNKNLGIKSENVISSKLFFNPKLDPSSKKWSPEEKEDRIKGYLNSYEVFKNELASNSAIVSVSQGSSLLKPYKEIFKADNGSEESTSQNMMSVSNNHLELFGFELLEGQFFNHQSDDPRLAPKSVVINEAAKKFWNIDDISTTSLLNSRNEILKILGVVKDFNYEHLSVKPQSLVMTYNSSLDADFYIQFQEGKVQDGLQFVESLFNKVNPEETFNYSFLSDDIAALYQKEKRLSIVYIFFTIIALLISAIGLFTIALYDTQKRIKEIGIRKVNGATIKEILLMLNKDFIKWVLIAFIIACPIAYYALSKWLENFAYKTNLSFWVFALAGIFTLIIAFLTVSWQSYTAAIQNPVESLRDE